MINVILKVPRGFLANDNLIKDIGVLLQLGHWEHHHIYREINQVVDWIVDVGHLVDSFMVITVHRYSRLSEIILYCEL